MRFFIPYLFIASLLISPWARAESATRTIRLTCQGKGERYEVTFEKVTTHGWDEVENRVVLVSDVTNVKFPRGYLDSEAIQASGTMDLHPIPASATDAPEIITPGAFLEVLADVKTAGSNDLEAIKKVLIKGILPDPSLAEANHPVRVDAFVYLLDAAGKLTGQNRMDMVDFNPSAADIISFSCTNS